MVRLLAVSHVIDRVNAAAAVVASWMVLLACLISAGNAVSRYLFSASSNAWLEIQWQLFSGIFLLGAAYVLKLNEHVRVDLFYGSRSERAKLWIDVIGLILLLLPGHPLHPLPRLAVLRSRASARARPRRTPAACCSGRSKMLLPLGFALLALQGVSELIKRVAALRGEAPAGEIVAYEKPLQ